MNAASRIGFLIFLLGIAQLIGNKTGSWVTFPFAGFITMAFGGIVLRFVKK